MRTWREADVVTLRDIKRPKIQDNAITCMFVGYSLEHDGIARERILFIQAHYILVQRSNGWTEYT